MYQKKFYISQDKLHVWKRFYLWYFFFWFFISLWLYSKSGNVVVFCLPIVFFIISYILHLSKTKRAALSFEENCLIIWGTRYSYQEIEKFWIGQGTVMRFGVRGTDQFVPVNKMLYIKIKNKNNPYRFDLENNFSENDSAEILSNLRVKNLIEDK